jgi:hypothetical protein
VLAALAAGCAKGVSFNGQQVANQPAGVGGPTAVNVPACEIDMPQLELIANVNSFEFVSSNGISFGYNGNGNFSGVGGSIGTEISTANMDLTMDGVNPLSQAMVVSTEITSSQTSTTINATIDYSGLSAGTTNLSQTPLGTVTSNGLALAVQGIKKQYDSVTWIGHVIQFVNSNTVMINGGFATGIEVGDTFNVYNVINEWQDMSNPCAAGNTYFGATPSPTTPVAVLTISSVDPSSNVGFATFVLTGSNSINLGAEVEPLKLVAAASGAPARYLKKNVILGTVAAKTFTLPGGGSFDFGTAINGQFPQAVLANGFYVMN